MSHEWDSSMSASDGENESPPLISSNSLKHVYKQEKIARLSKLHSAKKPPELNTIPINPSKK